MVAAIQKASLIMSVFMHQCDNLADLCMAIRWNGVSADPGQHGVVMLKCLLKKALKWGIT